MAIAFFSCAFISKLKGYINNTYKKNYAPKYIVRIHEHQKQDQTKENEKQKTITPRPSNHRSTGSPIDIIIASFKPTSPTQTY